MPLYRDSTLLNKALQFAFEACDTQAEEEAQRNPSKAKHWLALADQFEVLLGRNIDSLSPQEDQLALEMVQVAEQWLLSRIGKAPHVVSEEGRRWSLIIAKFRMRRWRQFKD